jgi:hypothetical protein
MNQSQKIFSYPLPHHHQQDFHSFLQQSQNERTLQLEDRRSRPFVGLVLTL